MEDRRLEALINAVTFVDPLFVMIFNGLITEEQANLLGYEFLGFLMNQT